MTSLRHEPLDWGQPARGSHTDIEQYAAPGPQGDREGAHQSPTPVPASSHTSQAERAVMHPNFYDLEWRYCRGGWAG
jgi:hypothetical protein